MKKKIGFLLLSMLLLSLVTTFLIPQTILYNGLNKNGTLSINQSGTIEHGNLDYKFSIKSNGKFYIRLITNSEKDDLLITLNKIQNNGELKKYIDMVVNKEGIAEMETNLTAGSYIVRIEKMTDNGQRIEGNLFVCPIK